MQSLHINFICLLVFLVTKVKETGDQIGDARHESKRILSKLNRANIQQQW